jgi:hypothetical protein
LVGSRPSLVAAVGRARGGDAGPCGIATGDTLARGGFGRGSLFLADTFLLLFVLFVRLVAVPRGADGRGAAALVVAIELALARPPNAFELVQVVESAALLAEALGQAVDDQRGELAVVVAYSVPAIVALAADELCPATLDLKEADGGGGEPRERSTGPGHWERASPKKLTWQRMLVRLRRPGLGFF